MEANDDELARAIEQIEAEAREIKMGRPRATKEPLFPTSIQISRGLYSDLGRLVEHKRTPFRSRSEAVRAAIAAMLLAYGYGRKEDW